jgi:hypothetical protein
VDVKPPSRATLEQQAYSFVKKRVTVGHPEVGQIGRWYDPICVTVVGLPDESQAAAIKARIESVSRAVGAPKAYPKCSPNVEIVFSAEPQQIMDLVADRREYLLGYDHIHLRDRLKRVTHPIQAWYVTSTVGSDAAAAMVSPQIRARGGGVIDDPWNTPPAGCAASHFTSCLQSEFVNVFVVADSKALEGKELGIVADYMVMLVLSQQRSLDQCTGLASIVDLFANPGCDRKAPDGLTPADAAFLTSLYAADLRAKRLWEQGDVQLRMARMLLKADALAKHPVSRGY